MKMWLISGKLNTNSNFSLLNFFRNYKIGRHPFDNEIVVYDPTISKDHAIFQIHDDNKAQILDLNTKNGTKINNNKISPKIFTTFSENDKIYLGAANSYLLLKVRKINGIEEPNLKINAGSRFISENVKFLKKKLL